MKRDIEERTFKFAIRVVKMSRSIPKTVDGRVLANQVLRSGTSVGANVEEAEAAYSKREFAMKMSVALKEARETHYWLRLIEAVELLKPARMKAIIQEAAELKKILGAIVSRARGKAKSPR
jgi:four helix bundle protein